MLNKGKGKGRTPDVAPQVDIVTTKVLRYMARTKQRRTYMPYTFPAIAGTHLPTREDGGLSKPRPMVQRATGPRLLHDSPRPTDANPRPRGRWSSALTTRPSRHRTIRLIHEVRGQPAGRFQICGCWLKCVDDAHFSI